MRPPSIPALLHSTLAITSLTRATLTSSSTAPSTALASRVLTSSNIIQSQNTFSFFLQTHLPRLFHTTSRTRTNTNTLTAKLTTLVRNRIHISIPPLTRPAFPLRKSLPTIPLLGSFFSSSSSPSPKMGSNTSSSSTGGSNYEVSKSPSEWQAVLTPQQFRILREKGTEAPFSGEYDKHQPQSGVYACAACSAPLYTAHHKFKSGCGWPAYFDSIPGAVERHEDRAFGMVRTEITCAKCGGHLGHVFKGEGYDTPTDERHCVNSVSLRFDKDGDETVKKEGDEKI